MKSRGGVYNEHGQVVVIPRLDRGMTAFENRRMLNDYLMKAVKRVNVC